MALDTGTLDKGNWAAVREERDDHALPIKGELPRELAGTLFRNGPNPQFDTPDSHWFVGDGMLHAFTLQDGKASYRNRWVRTPKFLAEHDAGRAIWSGKGFGGQKMADAPPTPITGTIWRGSHRVSGASWIPGCSSSPTSRATSPCFRGSRVPRRRRRRSGRRRWRT